MHTAFAPVSSLPSSVLNTPFTPTAVASVPRSLISTTSTSPRSNSTTQVSVSSIQAESQKQSASRLSKSSPTPEPQATLATSRTPTNSAGSPPSPPSKSRPALSATFCANCGTTTTPLWRRSPAGETICNACGLYLKARNQTRPSRLKTNGQKRTTNSPTNEHAADFQTSPVTAPTNLPTCGNTSTSAVGGDVPAVGSCPGDGHCNGTGGSAACSGCPAFNQTQVNRIALQCSNCGTTTTPLWRRDESGNPNCNACGLYYKLHGSHRPVAMKKSIIKRRKRVAAASVNFNSNHTDDDTAETVSCVSEDDNNKDTYSSESVRKKPRHNENSSSSHQHQSIPSSSSAHVPAIEDYIVPKRSVHGDPWMPSRILRLQTPPNITQAECHSSQSNNYSLPIEVQRNHDRDSNRTEVSRDLPTMRTSIHDNERQSERTIPDNEKQNERRRTHSHSISLLLNEPTDTNDRERPSLSSSISITTSTSSLPSSSSSLVTLLYSTDINAISLAKKLVSSAKGLKTIESYRSDLLQEMTTLSQRLNKTSELLRALDSASKERSYAAADEGPESNQRESQSAPINVLVEAADIRRESGE